MLYPIFLEMEGRPALVAGGGKVAMRKVAGLVEAGAEVTVVSPELVPELASMAERNEIAWRRKAFSPEDVAGAILIIAATNDRETNAMVKQAAGPHQLVNIADDHDVSDFQLPSVIRRGKLSLAVSTSGASPFLAKKIRRELEGKYDESYIDYLEFLDECRAKILNGIKDSERKRHLLQLITEETYFHNKKRRHELLESLKNEIWGRF